MVASAGRFGLDAERVLRETDRTQRLIDALVIRRGHSDLEEEHKALAIQIIDQLGSAMKG